MVTKLHYLESAPYDTALSGYALDISVTYVVTVANAMGSEYSAIYEPNSKVREIAINDYGFSEDNLTYRKLKNQSIPLSTPYAT